MNNKKVLTHMIRAGRDALHIDKTLAELGYKDTPYFSLYGEIAESIYCMIGENADSFESSATYAALHDIYTSDEMCAENLAAMCDESSGVMDTIPVSTRDVIIEAAGKRGMDPCNLVNLILSEWATRELLFTKPCT